MLFRPAILALLFVSLTASGMALMAGGFAVRILRFWDIASGSESQLRLERRTYLISTLLVFCFSAELAALLLFVLNAEAMSGQFVGAMCATGVLGVNSFGWPLLLVKIALFFCGVCWLLINHLDNQSPCYPLTRGKYLLLLVLLPLILGDTLLSFLYFLGLNPDVITSCCGSLFSADAQGVAAEVAALPPRAGLAGLLLTAALVLISGLCFLFCVRCVTLCGILHGLAAAAAFVAALVAVVAFIGLYVYEHPHHHCPFCILKAGHDFIGYLLYVPLFLAAGCGVGAAAVLPGKKRPDLCGIAETMARRLVWCSLSCFALFYALSAVVVYRSHLTMEGVWW